MSSLSSATPLHIPVGFGGDIQTVFYLKVDTQRRFQQLLDAFQNAIISQVGDVDDIPLSVFLFADLRHVLNGAVENTEIGGPVRVLYGVSLEVL